MKGLIKNKPEMGIWMTEIPMPEMGHNDVLIKIKKTAICGTDLHIYKWDAWAQAKVPIPLTIGHEFVGEIADMGQKFGAWKLGSVSQAKDIFLADFVAVVVLADDICAAKMSASV